MTSRAGASLSPPTWGGPRPLPAVRGASDVRRAERRALAPLELRGPRAFPSEAVAAVALLALWIALWATFTAGIVEPAAALLP